MSKRSKTPQQAARGPKTARRLRLRFRPDPLALALIALALAVRIWGVGDRLPDPSLGINVLDDSSVEETDRTTMGRAWTMWGGGTKLLDLNPHTGGWPGLSFYVGLGIQVAYKVTYSLSHPGTSPAAFAEQIREGSNHMFMFGRVSSLLIGVLTVFLAFRLGARLGGRAGGFLAGLFLALNPLHILISQHIADPNLLALLFVLVASLAMTRIVESGTIRDSVVAGAAIGLAGACKYVPLILVVPLAVAHGRGCLRHRAFYLGLLAVGLALFIASPYTFLDWKTTLQDIATQRKALFSDWVGQTTFPFSLPTYLAVSLPRVMGWPAYVLSLAGMALVWRRGAIAHPVALIPVAMVLANGALKAAQERYMLVALPILFLGTAMAILAAASWLRERVGAPSRAALAGSILAASIAIAWPLPEFFALRHALSLPDTRHLSRRWINSNIGGDRPMVVELYGPIFQPDERAMVIWPFFATQAPLVRPAYHAEFLDGFEYYIFSREVSRRFDADSAGYPIESGYYRWVRANAPVAWHSDSDSSSGPPIEVRRLPAGISTRAERDSLFARIMPAPSGVGRLALWCLDAANCFGRLSRYDRAEEWASRGLRVDNSRMNSRLHTTLAYANLNLRKFEEAASAAAAGVAEAPSDFTLRLYHGMALHELGFQEEGLKEFLAAYDLSLDPRFLLNIGASLNALGRYEEALKALGQVPPDHSERANARRDMAVILLNQLHRPVEGLAALRDAASLMRDPGQASLLREEVARLEGMMRKESPTPR